MSEKRQQEIERLAEAFGSQWQEIMPYWVRLRDCDTLEDAIRFYLEHREAFPARFLDVVFKNEPKLLARFRQGHAILQRDHGITAPARRHPQRRTTVALLLLLVFIALAVVFFLDRLV
jgi:hypothetical protein